MVAAKTLNVMFMGSIEDLSITRDQVVRGYDLGRKRASLGALPSFDGGGFMCGQPMSLMPSRRMIPLDAWLGKHVPIKAGERVDSRAVVENSISSNTLIQNRNPGPSCGGGEALGQLVGPIL